MGIQRRRRNTWRIVAPVLLLAALPWAQQKAEAQSELGRGAGSNVAYPFGSSSFGGRGGTYGNNNTVSSPGNTAPGMVGNPYASTAMNPFLNPYASMYAPATSTNAALYFFAAQQSMGGIGSGQMSGTRQAPAGPTAMSSADPERRVSDTPGAGASRYFNRSVKGGGVPNVHYNRYGNYYSANGH